MQGYLWNNDNLLANNICASCCLQGYEKYSKLMHDQHTKSVCCQLTRKMSNEYSQAVWQCLSSIRPIEKCNLTCQLWWLLAESTRYANFLVYENLREMSAYWNLMNKFFTITTEGTAFLPNCWLKHPITCLIPLCIYLQTTWWLSSIISSLSVKNVCCLFRPVRLVDQYPQRNKRFTQYANGSGLLDEHRLLQLHFLFNF
mgnify:FL=1